MNDEEKERSETWWVLVPVVVLSLLAYQIYDASMSSIFDEGDE